jgi:hypothetical protein
MHSPTAKSPAPRDFEDPGPELGTERELALDSELELDSDARVAIRPANPNRPSTSSTTPITISAVPDFLGGAP